MYKERESLISHSFEVSTKLLLSYRVEEFLKNDIERDNNKNHMFSVITFFQLLFCFPLHHIFLPFTFPK